VRYFGVSAFRAAIDNCLDLAPHSQGRIESSPELELTSPASLGVVTFRRHPSGVDDDADAIRSLALFASLDSEQAERVSHTAYERHALTGEAVVEQWQISRDLYVVMNGAVAIFVGGDCVGTLGPGDFFGELAAIDWGAGFGRTRSATVTATEPTRLLVLDWVLVNWLMKAAPAFGERLETASRDRLAAI
jgi:signal-transduction protein with cAMP-binding, CBS, and nucleotidyltransferase domain